MNIDTLNQYLFNQLARLDSNLTEEQLQYESTRSKAINDIAGTILNSAKLSLEAERFKTEITGDKNIRIPMLENQEQEQEQD